ncbi:hypothetical protein AAII07_14580 [Microvirga sp. 0TCS3.31]
MADEIQTLFRHFDCPVPARTIIDAVHAPLFHVKQWHRIILPSYPQRPSLIDRKLQRV